MSDELLPYYNRELSFIRRLGAQFAKDHPKIAGRLRLGEEGVSEDPHAERMIEAFAYLNARHAPQVGGRIPRANRVAAGRALPALSGPDSVPGHRAVRAGS